MNSSDLPIVSLRFMNENLDIYSFICMLLGLICFRSLGGNI